MNSSDTKQNKNIIYSLLNSWMGCIKYILGQLGLIDMYMFFLTVIIELLILIAFGIKYTSVVFSIQILIGILLSSVSSYLTAGQLFKDEKKTFLSIYYPYVVVNIGIIITSLYYLHHLDLQIPISHIICFYYIQHSINYIIYNLKSKYAKQRKLKICVYSTLLVFFLVAVFYDKSKFNGIMISYTILLMIFHWIWLYDNYKIVNNMVRENVSWYYFITAIVVFLITGFLIFYFSKSFVCIDDRIFLLYTKYKPQLLNFYNK